MKAIFLLYSVNNLNQVHHSPTVYTWTRLHLSEKHVYLNLKALRNNKFTIFFGKAVQQLFIPPFKVGFPFYLQTPTMGNFGGCFAYTYFLPHYRYIRNNS